MPTVPTVEPTQFRQGRNVTWKKSLSDYPATDSWILKYTLINSTAKVVITASADGADHLVDENAAATAAFTAGKYHWYSHVEKGADKHSIDEGEIEILADIESAANLDTRTEAQTNIDRIQALITGSTESSYSISTPDGVSRSYTRHDITELEVLLRYWKGRRNRELRLERARRGQGHNGRVLIYLD